MWDAWLGFVASERASQGCGGVGRNSPSSFSRRKEQAKDGTSNITLGRVIALRQPDITKELELGFSQTGLSPCNLK